MIALARMTAGVAAVFYLLAVVAFVIHAARRDLRPGVSFLGIGLALVTFVALWNEVAAT